MNKATGSSASLEVTHRSKYAGAFLPAEENLLMSNYSANELTVAELTKVIRYKKAIKKEIAKNSDFLAELLSEIGEIYDEIDSSTIYDFKQNWGFDEDAIDGVIHRLSTYIEVAEEPYAGLDSEDYPKVLWERLDSLRDLVMTLNTLKKSCNDIEDLVFDMEAARNAVEDFQYLCDLSEYTEAEVTKLKEELLRIAGEGKHKPELTSADPHERKLAQVLRDFTTQ